jgi:hypothetical protein
MLALSGATESYFGVVLVIPKVAEVTACDSGPG